MWQGALTTVPGVPTPASDFGVSIPQHPEFVVDLDEALKMTLAAPEEKEALVRSYYFCVDGKGSSLQRA